jgi:hypothetical protein
MNIFKKTFLSLTFIAAVGATASASADVISDTVQSTPNQAITFASPYLFTHNILDNGFIVGIDSVISAQLAIRLTDATGNEDYEFLVDAGQTLLFTNVKNNTVDTADGTTQTFLLSSTSLADLNADGLLSVTVKSLNNGDNFYFASSVLDATVTRGGNGAAIPEPTTVALLGLGLLGFTASRRKWAKSNIA